MEWNGMEWTEIVRKMREEQGWEGRGKEGKEILYNII